MVRLEVPAGKVEMQQAEGRLMVGAMATTRMVETTRQKDD